MLRFEGFSTCCGVYSRVDLRPDAFDVDLRGKGTTNVDFNERMRTALRRLTNRDDAAFQIGGRGVALVKGSEKIIERKVKLPVRWIKGFCEVQAYQPRLTPRYELTPLEARDLFRALPKANSRIGCFVAKTGRAYRMTPTPKAGAVRVDGADRVRVLEPLLASPVRPKKRATHSVHELRARFWTAKICARRAKSHSHGFTRIRRISSRGIEPELFPFDPCSSAATLLAPRCRSCRCWRCWRRCC